MKKRQFLLRAAIAALATLGADQVAADEEIGSIVGVRGRAQLRRASAGNWKTATVGAPLYELDEFRTDGTSRIKLYFEDESVVVLGKDSEATIKAFGKTNSNNILSLEKGRTQVVLPEVEGRETSTFEVETPTAVVQGNGSEFIAEFDPEEEVTQVYGVRSTVDVQGAIGLIGPTLKVGHGQSTRVEEGKFPEPAQTADATALNESVSELEVIGTGRADGVAATHPLLTGGLTRTDERPAAVHTGSARAGSVSYLDPQAPGETLAERMAPALRANTQPIPEYEFLDPIGR